MVKRIIFGVILSLAVTLVAFASSGVVQQPPTDGVGTVPTVPSLFNALTMVASGVTGGIVSFLLERTNWFDKMSSNSKWWLTFGLTVGLPVVAQLLIMFVPESVWAALQPIWQALALGFTTWLGSQVTHKLDKLAAALSSSGKP